MVDYLGVWVVELISQAEYARYRGVSQEAVRKALKAGRITGLPDEKGRVRIDPDVADIQWEKNTDPKQSARVNAPKGAARGGAPVKGAQGNDDGGFYWDARSRREMADARRAELELEKLEGTLVERKQVEAAASRIGRLLRDSLMGVPSRLAPELAAKDDVGEVEKALTDAIRGVLEDSARIGSPVAGCSKRDLAPSTSVPNSPWSFTSSWWPKSA